MGYIRFVYSNLWAWQLSNFPNAVLQNGVGRYVCQLQRLTLHFCKVSDESRAVRQYIENDLLNFANKNPNIVVYLRPHRLNPPFLAGEYLNGRTCTVDAKLFDRSDLKKWIEYLRTRSGQQIYRYEQNNRTEIPSVQGLWNPFTNTPTEMNVAKFPDEILGLAENDDQTATDVLSKLAKEQTMENVKIVQ